MLSVLEQTKPTKIVTLNEALSVAAGCKIVEYAYFEGRHENRARQRELFLADKIELPEFDYPYLLNLDVLYNTVETIQYALKIITNNIDVLGWDKAELYLASLIFSLKRAQLVIAAAQLNTSEVDSGLHAKAAHDFNELNSQLYGDINEAAYKGILKAEYDRAKKYDPKNMLANEIKADVIWVLDYAKSYENEERLALSDLIASYRPKVFAMYKNILHVVPEVGLFNAQECAEIMNKALEAGDLAHYGWKVVVDSKKTSPATHGPKKHIYLPADTVRNSDQLKGLILHEQEVHARRYQNGRHFTQCSPLASGTAAYLPVEEGLGTVMALLAAPGETSPIDRARTRYLHVGLALGIGAEPKDARQVFEIMWRVQALQDNPNGEITEAAAEQARSKTYVHIENIFRGTDCSLPGVVYSKAKVYYEGLLKTTKHLEAIKGDNAAFIRMFLGKYNHTDPTETARIMRIIKPA